MIGRPLGLPGLALVEPDVFGDDRGFFIETYSRRRYREIGIDVDFVQDNHSRSRLDTLRGLHFQVGEGQAKLVRVARGRAWDVVVDIRRDSPTFGRWEAVELDDDSHHQLYVPPGFAHGFVALSETLDFVYKVGTYYDATTERGLAWDDPDIGIEWPIDRPILSDRDASNPRLSEALDDLPTVEAQEGP